MFSYALSFVMMATALGQVTSPPTTTGANAPNQPEARQIDGQWQIAYIEMDGKEIKEKDFGSITIRDNVLTCKHEGKEKSWKLEFGPHFRVRAEQVKSAETATSTTNADAPAAANEKRSHGVYFAAKNYLCLSMVNGPDTTGGTGREPGATTRPNEANRPSTTEASRDHAIHGSHFVLILHRKAADTTTTR